MQKVIAKTSIKKVMAGLAALALVATAAIGPTPSVRADGPIVPNLCVLEPDLMMRSITINPGNTATLRFRNNGCATGNGFIVAAQVMCQNGSTRVELSHPAMGAYTDSQLTVPFAPGAKSIAVWLDQSQTSANNAVAESDELGNNYMSKQIGGVVVF